jgi:hypothetical protein
VVAHALKPSHLYPPVEGVVLVLVTVATCFLGYEAIRRVWLLRPLFGLDRDPGADGRRAPRHASSPAQRRRGEVVRVEHAVPQDIN